MRFRFRDKLLLAFGALLVATLVPLLLLVNAQIERISERKIEADLRGTRRVFSRFQAGRLSTYSERTTSFILTQPEVRAAIATVENLVLAAESPSAEVAGPPAEDPFGAISAGQGQVFRPAAAGSRPTRRAPAPAAAAPAQPAPAPPAPGGGDPFGAVSAGQGQTFDPAGAASRPARSAPAPAAAAPAQPAPAPPAPGGGDPFGAVSAGQGQTFDPAGAGSRPARNTTAVAPPAPVQPTAAPQPAGRDPGALPERQGRLLSIVEDVSLYRDSAVFFLTDFRGTVVFNKADPHRFGMTLAHLPAVRTALAGNEVFTWWGSLRPEPTALGLLPQEEGVPRLFQMFLKPAVFAGEVKGLVAIGFPFTEAELEEVIGITRADVAFVADDVVYVNSRPAVPAARLLALAQAPPATRDGDGSGAAAPGARPAGTPTSGAPAAAPGEGESSEEQADRDAAGAVQRFLEGEDEYLALRVPVRNTLGDPVGTVLVYRSKTEEKRVFSDLRRVLNGIGLAALVVAALLALGLSHSVARVVRQLFHGVTAVREGDLDVRLDIRSRDEFGELGRAFNEMTAGLKEKEQIRSTFKRYVSSTVVDELLRGGDSVKLGGESKQLTIQFSDIAGFTALSEALSPEQVVEFLNAYLSRMTVEVEAEAGIVDKYIGDAVMAFWGAPLPLADHADHACRAALRQLREVAALRAGWAQQGDLGRFDVRLGLHSGEVVVGNIGSDTRMDYTIIGDSVNTASRLEGMNKVYGTHILLSEDTRALLQGAYVTRELDRIRMVGKTRPVRIYELLALEGEADAATLAVHARFAEALALYRERRFAEAGRDFAALVVETGDAPAEAYQRRCAEYAAAPPPEDWDGVYVSVSK